ncbi:MAG: DUF2207 domain-containing protein, partial [candidate division Zixibacteria bacterium]|nr:DUF2207 domain-containing protein [candidate division Zixibacteria bacterium]
MNNYLVIRRLFAAAVLFCLVAAVPAAAEYFEIDRFHSDITVQEDGSIDVTETIEVTFSRQRHGIFRAIPYKYRDELGKMHRAPIEVHAVTDEHGRAREMKVTREGNVINIRIGSASRYVNGRQTYVITYTVDNMLLYLDDRDELYWNVTGDMWEVSMAEVSADIRLPFAPTQTWTACYTGRRGSNESACTAEAQETQGAHFAATRMLYGGEGFTIALGWNKGLVAQPSGFMQFLWRINIGDNWVLIFPPIIFVYMFFRWRKRGRDPRVMESVTVQYEPPKVDGVPLTPAESGTLIDETLDPRDITAGLIGLASKGFLTIEEDVEEGLIALLDKTDYKVQKEKEPDDTLTPFEFKLMTALFPGDLTLASTLRLKNKFYKHLPKLQQAQYNELVRKGLFQSNPNTVRQQTVGVGIAVAIVGVILGFMFNPEGIISVVVASVLSGAAIAGFASAMPARTRKGVIALRQVQGFQEFMNRVERDVIERMDIKDVFYRYMPYAIALDVVDQWAEAFEGLETEPPTWYRTRVPTRAFTPRSFSQI